VPGAVRGIGVVPIVPMPEGDGADPNRKCVQLSGDDGFRPAVSPSHPVAVLPETGYVFCGKVKTDGKVGGGLGGWSNGAASDRCAGDGQSMD